MGRWGRGGRKDGARPRAFQMSPRFPWEQGSPVVCARSFPRPGPPLWSALLRKHPSYCGCAPAGGAAAPQFPAARGGTGVSLLNSAEQMLEARKLQGRANKAPPRAGPPGSVLWALEPGFHQRGNCGWGSLPSEVRLSVLELILERTHSFIAFYVIVCTGQAANRAGGFPPLCHPLALVLLSQGEGRASPQASAVDA